MDFEKKMKTRLYLAVTYCLLGSALMIVDLIKPFGNEFIFPFGFSMLILGVLRLFQYRKITKDEKTMHRREIAEADERTRMLSERAKSWTFSFMLIMAGIAVIILSVLGYHEQAQPIAWIMCLTIGVYWVFYLLASKKY